MPADLVCRNDRRRGLVGFVQFATTSSDHHDIHFRDRPGLGRKTHGVEDNLAFLTDNYLYPCGSVGILSPVSQSTKHVFIAHHVLLLVGNSQKVSMGRLFPAC